MIMIMIMMIHVIESNFDKDAVLSRGIGSATIQGMILLTHTRTHTRIIVAVRLFHNIYIYI